jgi:anthranilate synthase component I
VTARQAWEGAQDRIDDAVGRMGRTLPYTSTPPDIDSIAVKSNTSQAEYARMVEDAKEYIRAGDIFQVVLSQRFEAEFTLPPTALYRALRRTNPSPYMYMLDFGDFAVAGSSPEILVKVENGKVNIRPIAGTRKRGATPTRDKELADELLSDPKELAEHLMLLDLGRNDVGRVAKIGSVKVTDKFFLEYYSHVMHIVSNVVGDLDPKHDFVDALAAGFPAGTVSGAPKVRAMEIIDELEKSRRGIYGGCVGYFGADGTMDTCIVLRTAIVSNGKIYVQAGAGIVADSKAELEQLECENKARALFSAAEEALRYAGEARVGQ